MIRASALIAAILLAVPVAAQQRVEKDVSKQRAAVEALTTCIADKQGERVRALLAMDFLSKPYRDGMAALARSRTSQKCLAAIPRAYGEIQMGGLLFAGGLAERLIEHDDVPLGIRLDRAAVGAEATTYSPTDAMAHCMLRGAPQLAAALFDAAPMSPGEEGAIAQLVPVANICLRGQGDFEASPLELRSMLATAAFRLLAAQENDDA